MDDETMQLLKVLRAQLGKTSASRSVDALAAANSLGLERDSLEFHRRLHDLLRAKYLGARKPRTERTGEVFDHL